MGLCVMSTKKNALTIDLDAEDTIFHLKVCCFILQLSSWFISYCIFASLFLNK